MTFTRLNFVVHNYTVFSDRQNSMQQIQQKLSHYTRCITPKRVTSLHGSFSASLRPGNRAFFEISLRWWAVGRLCPIWPALDLNGDLLL